MAMLPNRDNELEFAFPGVIVEGYTITSPQDIFYNCIAWAAKVDHQWWWPDPMGQYFWPESIPRVCTVEAFVQAYQLLGYTLCQSAENEKGYEKIVVYVDINNIPTHAARQIDKNIWTSKLGRSYDISHTLKGFEKGSYGTPHTFMKRKVD